MCIMALRAEKNNQHGLTRSLPSSVYPLAWARRYSLDGVFFSECDTKCYREVKSSAALNSVEDMHTQLLPSELTQRGAQ